MVVSLCTFRKANKGLTPLYFCLGIIQYNVKPTVNIRQSKRFYFLLCHLLNSWIVLFLNESFPATTMFKHRPIILVFNFSNCLENVVMHSLTWCIVLSKSVAESHKTEHKLRYLKLKFQHLLSNLRCKYFLRLQLCGKIFSYLITVL